MTVYIFSISIIAKLYEMNFFFFITAESLKIPGLGSFEIIAVVIVQMI